MIHSVSVAFNRIVVVQIQYSQVLVQPMKHDKINYTITIKRLSSDRLNLHTIMERIKQHEETKHRHENKAVHMFWLIVVI